MTTMVHHEVEISHNPLTLIEIILLINVGGSVLSALHALKLEESERRREKTPVL